jgi:hypothetical protein
MVQKNACRFPKGSCVEIDHGLPLPLLNPECKLHEITRLMIAVRRFRRAELGTGQSATVNIAR